jgi:hypothetical protein
MVSRNAAPVANCVPIGVCFTRDRDEEKTTLLDIQLQVARLGDRKREAEVFQHAELHDQRT